MNTTNIKIIGQYALEVIVATGIIVLMALKVVPVSAGLPVLTLAAGFKAGGVVAAKKISAK